MQQDSALVGNTLKLVAEYEAFKRRRLYREARRNGNAGLTDRRGLSAEPKQQLLSIIDMFIAAERNRTGSRS